MSVDLMKKNFDVATFNKEFEAYKISKEEEKHKKEMEDLKKLNKEIKVRKLSEMSMNELIIEWKNSMIGIMNDLLNGRWSLTTIFSGNRLFFAGVTLILITVLFYFIRWIFHWNINDKENVNKTINEYHIFVKNDQSKGLLEKLGLHKKQQISSPSVIDVGDII